MPNILVLLSDQLRRQALGIYGDPDARTPHLDAFAQQGIRFDNACSTYPICVPFRFTLMTGEYAHVRKVPGIEYVMSTGERTLADEFNDPFDTCYFEDDDPTPKKIEGYQTDGLFQIGMDYIRDRVDDRPFCMVISVEPPHDPFVAPEDVQSAWEARDIILPENFDVADPVQRETFILNRKRYNAMVENLDANVGKMMAFLKAEGLLDDTVVVFLSDHGELAGAHGLRAKQWPYEESVGIPLMVWDSRAGERAGTVIKDPTCTEDLFPTLLGLAGITAKNEVPGTNLTPLIHGDVNALV